MPTKAFREVLKTESFIVTADVGPVKGSDTTRMIEQVGLLRDKVHALNATDNKSSVMRYPSLGSCLLIKELGGEPVLNITCRDRNRLAIQADLLFAWSRGISNVLCVTGDSMEVGEDMQAKPVFDLNCIQLIHLVKTLNSGKDMSGNELNGGTDFCIGATTAWCANPTESQQASLQKKLETSIDFILTQAVYEIDDLKRLMSFVRKLDVEVKVLVGIMPLVSVAMGRYMNSNMPGVSVPERFLSEMAQAPRGAAVAKGIELAAKMVGQIREEKICDGVHIMFPGREERIPDVIEASGLLKVNF
jgi:methylenetetrahydrofolate reductase (NADPH)